MYSSTQTSHCGVKLLLEIGQGGGYFYQVSEASHAITDVIKTGDCPLMQFKVTRSFLQVSFFSLFALKVYLI